MDFHPLGFNGYQALFFEPVVVHCQLRANCPSYKSETQKGATFDAINTAFHLVNRRNRLMLCITRFQAL
jgi:hypothetical protein